jgi:hypothetical protein
VNLQFVIVTVKDTVCEVPPDIDVEAITVTLSVPVGVPLEAGRMQPTRLTPPLKRSASDIAEKSLDMSARFRRRPIDRNNMPPPSPKSPKPRTSPNDEELCGATPVGAVVVIVSVEEIGAPFGVTLVGLNVQVALAGRLAQLNWIGWLNPPIGVTVKVATPNCP